MKAHSYCFAVCVCSLSSMLHAQNGEQAPTADELRDVFSVGTYFGKTGDVVEHAQIFGKRHPPELRGRFNVPFRVDFSGDLGSDINNPYITEVGYFKDKTIGYFLVWKKPMVRTKTLNDAEVEALLYKVATGGKWSLKNKEDGRTTDYKGSYYEYLHSHKGQDLRFFAYRTPKKQQLLVYAPKVSPDLDGTASSPRVDLVWLDGVRVPWFEGDESSARVVRFIPVNAPPKLTKACENGVLSPDSFSEFGETIMDGISKIRGEYDQKEFDKIKNDVEMLNKASKKKSDWHNITVESETIKNILNNEGEKKELMRQIEGAK